MWAARCGDNCILSPGFVPAATPESVGFVYLSRSEAEVALNRHTDRCSSLTVYRRGRALVHREYSAVCVDRHGNRWGITNDHDGYAEGGVTDRRNRAWFETAADVQSFYDTHSERHHFRDTPSTAFELDTRDTEEPWSPTQPATKEVPMTTKTFTHRLVLNPDDRVRIEWLQEEIVRATLEHPAQCNDGKASFLQAVFVVSDAQNLEQFEAHLVQVIRLYQQAAERGDAVLRRLGLLAEPKRYEVVYRLEANNEEAARRLANLPLNAVIREVR